MTAMLWACARGSAVVAALLVLRHLFGARVRPSLLLFAWDLALLLLLVPVGVESPLSAWGVLPRRDRVEVSAYQSEHLTLWGADTGVVHIQTSVPASLDVAGIIVLAVWAVGATIALVFMVASFTRAIRSARPLREPTDPVILTWRRVIRLWRNVRVLESDAITSPFTYGILRPVIVVPAGFVESQGEARARTALDHELSHVRAYDQVRLALWSLACCLYWFDPLVWAARSRMARDMELARDADALKGRDDLARLDYALTIIDVAGLEVRGRGVAGLGGPSIEARVRAIVAPSKRSPRLMALFAALMFASVATLGTASSLPSQAVVDTGLYSYALPSYWSGRVCVGDVGDGSTVVYVEGHPDLVIAAFERLEDNSEGFGLHETTGCSMLREVTCSDGSVLRLWCINYASMSQGDLWRTSNIATPGWPGTDMEREVIDLSTGGRHTAEELWEQEEYPSDGFDFCRDALASTLRAD